MDLFLVKKIITVLIMPISIVLLLLFLGLLLHRKNPRQSFKYLLSATAILLFASFPPVADNLMSPIENQYQPYSKSNSTVDYIIVLGCGHTSNLQLPATAELANCSLQRMVETLRIFKLHPESRIITSGYAANDIVTNAEKVKQALVILGVPEQKIINENFPKDTEEEAQLISPRVQGTNVVLVTNADHMPRAMNYFQANGVKAIAAPTGYWVKDLKGEKTWAYYYPNSRKLQQTTIAWYESLGLIIQWVKSIFN